MQNSKKQLAARLKHEITFSKNLATNDIAPEVWQDTSKTFAEIIAISENKFESIEGLNFGHIITEGFFLFITRFIEGINIKMRIIFKARTFEIKRIINIKEQGRLLKIIAMEI
ncbi:MAG: head-tail adaptor protein [Janthinobacterium lividum]